MVRGRAGKRVGSRLLVVHVAVTDPRRDRSPRVGFVVSKGVGSAVIRNRTKRRLRALMAAHLAGLPGGVDLVVRAQPAAGAASFAELGADLEHLLPRVLRRLPERAAP